MIGLPPGLSIDPASGDITGTIADSAADGVPYAVTLAATDGANSASQNFNWTVTHVFVVSPGDQQNADGDSVVLPINAGENNGDPVTITAAGLPPGLSINSAGNIAGTISNTADMNSPYTVTVTATDGTYSDSQTFTWTVTHFQLANPGDQSNYDGDTVSLQLSATDNLGDTVTYSAGGLPPGLSINPQTGMISGLISATADVAGPYSTTVSATVGDASASQTFTWNVNNPISIAPLGDQTNALGDAVSLGVSATSATGDPLTYSAGGLPPGVSIDATSGLISGTISTTAEAGSPYGVTVTASDGSLSASTDFDWTISYLTLTNPGDQTNASGDAVSLGLTASDNMGDTLTYSAGGLPPGLSINAATGLISGTIALNADAGGPYSVTASVSGGGNTASQSFTWNVYGIVITDPGTQTNADGDTVSLQINATDHSAGALTYGAGGLPPGLSINTATGVISGAVAPTADQGGPYSVTVTASDPSGRSASDTFTWNVTQLTLTNPGTQQNADGDTVTLTLQANGAPSGATLTYGASGLPPGLALNTSTGVVSGLLSMTADAGGPYTVTATAADGNGASASQTFTWNIDKLTLDNPGNQTEAAGQVVSLALNADDNDGSALTYSATGLPAGLIQQGADIVGTVLASDVSGTPYNILATVTDGLGLTASVTFVMDVGTPTSKFSVGGKPIQGNDPVIVGIDSETPVLQTPRFDQVVEVSVAALKKDGVTNVSFSLTGAGKDRAKLGKIVDPSPNDNYYLVEVSGVTPSVGATADKPAPPLDTFLTVTDTTAQKVWATLPVEVEVPKSIQLPTNFGPKQVKGKNMALNDDSSPGIPVPNTPAGKKQVELVTGYGTDVAMTVLDQFGKTLTAYSAAHVNEKLDQRGWLYIHQNVQNNGTYTDPVYYLRPLTKPNNMGMVDNVIVLPDSQDAKNWLKGTDMVIPNSSFIPYYTFQIQVGGHVLAPIKRAMIVKYIDEHPYEPEVQITDKPAN